MNNRITIKEALSTWAEYRRQFISQKDHLDIERTRSIIQQKGQLTSHEIEHLILCSTCLNKLSPTLNHEESPIYWETAWRKAAASKEVHWPFMISSEKNTYQIEIRESESHKNQGAIIVYINDQQKKEFEGKKILVIDGKGRQLLKGEINNGEVSQRLDKLNTIDLQLSVRIIN